jgi:hypothetical membrane protein
MAQSIADGSPGRSRSTLDAVLAGPAAAVVLALTILTLPAFVPGYDGVRQTVSEIGEVGSPARLPFTLALFTVSGLNLIFAVGLHQTARRAGATTAPAWLVGSMTVTIAGVGYFAYPHPLHGVFGLSELVGYQAPLALALGWRGRTALRGVVIFSGVMAFFQEASLAANLSVLDFHGAFYAFERPVYGIVQRTLFASWCAWCFGTGLWLWRAQAKLKQRPGKAMPA